MIERMKNTVCGWFEGELTISKHTLWMAGTLLFLAGVLHGLRMAPWTHGVRIGCNNVSQNDCCFGKECEEEED